MIGFHAVVRVLLQDVPRGRDVIDLDATFGQQVRHVTGGRAEHGYQRTATAITSLGSDGQQEKTTQTST